MSLTLGSIGTSAAAPLPPAATLVKNIHEGPRIGTHSIRLSAPLKAATAGGQDKAVLVLSDVEHGEELWITDGLSSTLTLLKDIRPGWQGSGIRALTVVGSRVFFLADDGEHGEEIWVTDGTPAGTRLVADLTDEAGRVSTVRGIKPFKNGLMFVAESDLHPTALWFTDGTAAGTLKLKTLVPGTEDAPSQFAAPGWVAVGGQFYFMLEPAGLPYELWKTDATAAGTVLVKTFPRPKVSIDPHPSLIGDMNGQLLFQVPREQIHFDLMKTNGTAKGTVKIATTQWDRAEPDQIAVKDGKAWFLMRIAGSSHDIGDLTLRLWSTDGTAKGTQVFGEAAMSYTQPLDTTSSLYRLRLIGNRLIMPLSEGNSIWPFTQFLAVNLATQQTFPESFRGAQADVVITGDTSATTRMVIAGHDVDHGTEISITDGTEEGTVSLPDDGYRGGLTALGSGFIFACQEPSQSINYSTDNWHPAKLVRYTGESASEYATLPGPDASSAPAELRVMNNQLFFSATDAVYGRELWQSDGTGAGTVLSLDVLPGKYFSNPRDLTVFKNHLFFAADREAYLSHSELHWRTPAGALGRRTYDQPPYLSEISSPSNFYATTDRLFFRAPVANNGTEFWATAVPFQLPYISPVADLIPGSGSSLPRQFIEMDGWLYFTATSAISGKPDVLWRMPLTTGGQPSEVPMQGGNTSSPNFPSDIKEFVIRPPNPTAPYPAESLLYFTNGLRLYMCRNGQPFEIKTSTVAFDATPFVPIHNLRLHNGEVYFTASGYTGISSGVYRIADPSPYVPATIALNSDTLAFSGQTFYYTGRTEAGGFTLDRILRNGSGRVRLLTLDYDPDIRLLHVEGNTVFFTRRSSASGPWAVWMTQGTPETTLEIPGGVRAGADVAKDNAVVLNNQLYFTAVHPQLGHELHALPLNNWLSVTDVTVPENPVRMTEDAKVDLGVQGVSRVLRFSNDGPRSLPALSLTGLSSTPFTADVTAIPALAPGASADVTIRLTASNPGNYSAEMRIFLEGVSHHTHTHRLQLKGSNLETATGSAAYVLQAPRSYLTLPGDTVTLEVQALNVTSAQWYRDLDPFAGLGGGSNGQSGGGGVGIAQPRDDEPTGFPPPGTGGPPQEPVGSGLTLLRNVTAADAGVYTLSLNGATAPNAILAVVQPAPAEAWATLGGRLVIDCRITPTRVSNFLDYSSRLDIQWFRNGVPLTDIDRRRGTRSTRLEIDAVQLRDVGDYSCKVTLYAPDGVHELNHGSTRFTVLNNPQPVLPEGGQLSHFVGQPVNHPFTADQYVDRFTFKGLPPGLKATAAGLITGIPTKAQPVDPATGLPRPYIVTVNATNAAGTGTSSTFKWYIHSPMPAGIYEGLLGREETPAEGVPNLGGRVKLTFTTAGALSGTLVYRGRSYSFTGGTGLTVGVVPDVAGSLIRVDIPQPKPKPAFQLFIVPSENRSGLTLDTRDGHAATGMLQKQILPADAASLWVHPLYTAALTPPENASTSGLPAGHGFISATLSKKGSVTWKGKLADGTAVTGSGLLLGTGGDFNLPVHLPLYKATGSLHGWASYVPRITVTAANKVFPSRLTGLLSWSKDAQPATSKDRAYRSGFPAHDLDLRCKEYAPPAKGQILLDLPAGPDNARISITGPNVPQPASQPITLTATPKPFTFASPTAAAPLKTLSVFPATGTFKGTLLFPHTDPKLNRTVTFEGLLCTAPGPATGFFLLPDLPGENEPVSALKTTPLQSGTVELGGVLP